MGLGGLAWYICVKMGGCCGDCSCVGYGRCCFSALLVFCVVVFVYVCLIGGLVFVARFGDLRGFCLI